MLTPDEIQNLLKSTETARVERTVSTGNMDKFSEAICAFSNDVSGSGKPGYLILGAHDNGDLSGLKVTDDLFKKIAGIRSDGNILPIPVMNVEKVEYPEGDLLVVEVMPSMFPPVKYRGRTFIRIGPRRDIATEAEERMLIERRTSYMASWDSMPCLGTTLDDLDITLFNQQYLPLAIPQEVRSMDNRDVTEQMASLRLYDKTHNCPTNAAILLFGKNPTYFFPGAYIQHVQFAGADNASDIVNENVFSGNLMTMLPRLKTFVETALVAKRPMPISALQEVMKSNYPEWAVRELLMNTVMHRDYQSNTPTKLYVYADRMEITNPGGLYGNARPENFPTVNDYRNPVLAEALKVLGYVNKYNRGISRVQSELRENGNGTPDFVIDKITVFQVAVGDSFRNVINPVNQQSNQQSNQELLADLTSKSLRMLAACTDALHSKEELFAVVGLTPQTNNVRRHLTPLLTAGLLTYEDPSLPAKRGQRYRITEKGVLALNLLNVK